MRTRNLFFVILTSFVFLFFFSIQTYAEEKDPINFIYITDLTGPAAAQCAPLAWAFEDYFESLNKKGGINGHPVNIELVDTAYKLPQMRTAYSRAKRRKQTTISFDSLSAGIEALKERFAKDKIPVLMATGHGPGLYPPGWVVSMMPPYDDTLCAMADWIKEGWDKERKPRVALLLGDYASGRSPEEAKWYVEQKGIEIVAVEYCPLQPTDTSSLLSRIANAEPDFIFDTLMPDQAKVVLKDKHNLNIEIPQVAFVFNSQLIKRTVSPEAYEGYMGFQATSSWWEKDKEGVQLAHKLYENRGSVPPYAYTACVGAAMIWENAVRNALENVGYKGLDGKSIMEGYLEIENFDAKGLFNNVSYSRDDLRGNKWLKICRLNEDGSVSNVTDWMEAPWNLKLKAQNEE